VIRLLPRPHDDDRVPGEPAEIRARKCRPCGGGGVVIVRRWFRRPRLATCGQCNGLGRIYGGLSA
jgi:DnaJ-class molecular chaperone